MAAPQTWLITGASSGFGAILSEAVLKAGHRVVATARNPVKAAQTCPQIESLGGTWLQLDVTRPDTKETVEEAIRKQGRIDVVVNNAGYALLGSVEDMRYAIMNRLNLKVLASSDNRSEEEIHQQINTNVYGPMRVIKAALPFMRAQRSGTIVNISSIAGLQAQPSCSLYAASKFALEGTFTRKCEMTPRLTITRFLRVPLERSRLIQYPSSHRGAWCLSDELPIGLCHPSRWTEPRLRRHDHRPGTTSLPEQQRETGRRSGQGS